MTCPGTDLKDLSVAHKGLCAPGQHNSVATISVGQIATHRQENPHSKHGARLPAAPQDPGPEVHHHPHHSRGDSPAARCTYKCLTGMLPLLLLGVCELHQGKLELMPLQNVLAKHLKQALLLLIKAGTVDYSSRWRCAHRYTFQGLLPQGCAGFSAGADPL